MLSQLRFNAEAHESAWNVLWYMSSEPHVTQTAKLFTNGRSQAVRLPVAFRFDTKEVFIRRDPKTGDVILSRKPTTWDGFFTALQAADIPTDFLSQTERAQAPMRGIRWRGSTGDSSGAPHARHQHRQPPPQE